MSTHCQRLSFSASFSFFPCVCGCVDLCGEREKQYRQGEVKKLSSEGQLATQGLIVFCRSPAGKRRDLFFLSSSFRWKAYYFPCSLSLSFSLVHTLAPFHILMPFKCHLFTWGTLWRWGIRSNQGYYPCGRCRVQMHYDTFLRLATAAVCHFSGIKWHYGEVAVMGTAWAVQVERYSRSALSETSTRA